MQIASLAASKSQAAPGAGPNDDTDRSNAAAAFAQALATAFDKAVSALGQPSELKRPEAAPKAPADRPAERGADRAADRAIERRETPKADDRQPEAKAAESKPASNPPAPKATERKPDQDARKAEAPTDEAPAADAAAEKIEKPETAADATQDAAAEEPTLEDVASDKPAVAEVAAEEALAALLLGLVAPAAAPATAVAQAAAQVAQNAASSDETDFAAAAHAAAGIAVLPAAAAAVAAAAQQDAGDLAATLQQQLQQATLPQGPVPNADEAAFAEAAKAALVQASERDGKLSIQVETLVQGDAPKPLVDPAALLLHAGADALPIDAELVSDLTPDLLPQGLIVAQTVAAAVAAEHSAAFSAAASSQNGTGTHPVLGVTAASQAAHGAAHLPQAQAARHMGAWLPPGEQVAVQVKRAVAEGVDSISIKLDPGDLGKVEVKMEVGQDGRLLAVIAVDKPETLLLLQKDAGTLEQSLRDAGLKTSSDSLSFSLRDQSGAEDGRQGRRGSGRGGNEYGDAANANDPQSLAASAAQRAAARGGLDIRI